MIESIFPTYIGLYKNDEHENIASTLVDACYRIQQKVDNGAIKFISNNTYSTHGQLNLFNYPAFDPITRFITKTVFSYCDELGYETEELNPIPKQAWFNIHKKNDYSEFHYHPDTFLNAVYYLKAERGSANLWLRSDTKDMVTLPGSTENTVHIESQEGLLVIFKSSIDHAVERHIIDSDRISLAYNYGLK